MGTGAHSFLQVQGPSFKSWRKGWHLITLVCVQGNTMLGWLHWVWLPTIPAYCYILLVTELFSFPVPGQSWNRLWMCVGQGEGKLRVTVSLHSGAFSFSIKLAAFRLPVGLAFFSLVYYFQRRECIWQSENSTSLNTDGRDYTTLSPDLQKPAVSFQGFSSLTGGLAFVNYFH